MSDVSAAVGLAGFLLERFAEDEADARKATAGEWRATEYGVYGSAVCERNDCDKVHDVTVLYVDPSEDHADAAHIARHDPARVLAECRAKRRIVVDCVKYENAQSPYYDGGPNPLTGTILRLLAQPYADHPDFRGEWRA